MTDPEWMRADGAPIVPVNLRTDIPHPARVYDYLLGGKDNFAADREAAEQAMRTGPANRTTALQNRAFLRRAVRLLAAEHGVDQFLDLGTGLPTSPNVHEVAQAVHPRARVVYTDNDPIVLAHARALLSSHPAGRTAYLDGDLREPDRILADPVLAATLDLDRPVGLLLISVLHFVGDDGDPYGLVRRFLDALPSGSFLVMSHATGDFAPEQWRAVTAQYAARGTTMRVRSRAEFAAFFDGLDPVPPGPALVTRWRPDPGDEPDAYPDAEISLYGALARKR